MEIEIWKDVTGYEGQYQVSDLGRVRSFKSGKIRILNPTMNSSGYYIVNLHINSIKKLIRIHQLVAIEFLHHPPDGYKMDVDHINGIKTDNRLENLRIVTHGENTNLGLDRKATSSAYKGVSWNKLSNKWQAQIGINGRIKYLGRFDKEEDAANAYNEGLNKINNKNMITLFDFTYPPIDLSNPIRNEKYPFTYYPNCGALVPDEGIEIHTRSDSSQWYSGTPYNKRYSKRAIIGKILGIKPGFILKNHNPYDWRRENIIWLDYGSSYQWKKENEIILKATLDKIKRDNLCPSILDYEKFFEKNKGNLDQ